MTPDVLQTTSTAAASLSALAAVLAGACAFLSYKLARQIRNELKADERLIAGVPIHPDLREPPHAQAVIQCTLFNKSKRKCFISEVTAETQAGHAIEITWSDKIDDLGNPQNPCQLIGIVDSCQLFLRRNDGTDITFAKISVRHSFSEIPMTIMFEPFAALGRTV